MKRCSKCRQEKPLDQFWGHRKHRDGKSTSCISCTKADRRLRRAEDAANMRAYRQRRPEVFQNIELKKRFGISLDDYNVMLEAQDHRCAICGEPESAVANHRRGVRRMSVDHNHVTGEIRGLVCSTCNRGLGMFRDSPDLLIAAAAYLTQHGYSVIPLRKEVG